nr:MAG TPA: putative protease [Caudoviricetes sp.]
MSCLEFDLGLLGEDAGGDGGAAPPAGGAPLGGDPAGAPPAGGESTILGGQQNPQGGDPPPGVPDAYDFKSIVPEGMEYDEQSAAAFSEVAKKAGLSQEQASSIAAYGMQYMQQGAAAAMQEIAAIRTQWGEDARSQLGGQFEVTVAKAAAGRDALAAKVPGLVDMLNETGAGNRVEMIRLMAAVGELIGEDGGLRGTQAGAEKSIYPNTDFKRYS